MATKRDVGSWPDRHFEYDSIEAFLSSDVSAGLISIHNSGPTIDILNRSSDANTTIVMFHAALVASTTTLPVFAGQHVTEGLDANVVYVADPSLYLDPDLRLAWYAGNQAQQLQSLLVEVIKHIHASNGGKHLVFFGPSGGGFASLWFSRHFPNSLAIAVNPQTIIGRYFPASVAAFAKACFGTTLRSEIDTVLDSSVTSDLRRPYASSYSNTVAYVQNSADLQHVDEHLIPFLNDIQDKKRIHLLMRNWGRGHVVPPKDVISTILSQVVNHAPAWKKPLDQLGFRSNPDEEYVLRERVQVPAPLTGSERKPGQNGGTLGTVRTTLRRDGTKFDAFMEHVNPPDEPYEYAFYLMRNGQKIETVWYSFARNATFDVDCSPGEYQAIGFARSNANPDDYLLERSNEIKVE